MSQMQAVDCRAYAGSNRDESYYAKVKTFLDSIHDKYGVEWDEPGTKGKYMFKNCPADIWASIAEDLEGFEVEGEQAFHYIDSPQLIERRQQSRVSASAPGMAAAPAPAGI